MSGGVLYSNEAMSMPGGEGCGRSQRKVWIDFVHVDIWVDPIHIDVEAVLAHKNVGIVPFHMISDVLEVRLRCPSPPTSRKETVKRTGGDGTDSVERDGNRV